MWKRDRSDMARSRIFTVEQTELVEIVCSSLAKEVEAKSNHKLYVSQKNAIVHS